MRVLAVDPASTVLGWAVMDYSKEDVQWVSHGEIDVTKVVYERRPSAITGHMQRLQLKYKAQELAIEMPFRSPKFRVDELGVAYKAIKKWAVRNKLAVFMYAVPQWKGAVIGKGNATKEQVQAVVLLLLEEYGLETKPLHEHEADALAIAEYHVRMRRFEWLAQTQGDELNKRLGISKGGDANSDGGITDGESG